MSTLKLGPDACRRCRPGRLCRWCAHEQERRDLIKKVTIFFDDKRKLLTAPTQVFLQRSRASLLSGHSEGLRRHVKTVHAIARRISGKRSAQPDDVLSSAINEWASHHLA